MYVPRAFVEEDVGRLHALMRAHAFATLVTAGDGAPVATHVPLVLEAGRGPLGTLLGHVARANPHWRAFDGATPALAVFSGPHAYVSPRWYASARNVPTWNYVAVHASGTPRVVEEPEAVLALLRRSVDVFEAGLEQPMPFDAMPADYVAGLAKAIVAFELPIARLEGKRKLSQNKSAADRAGAALGLRATRSPEAQAVATLMEQAASEGARR